MVDIEDISFSSFPCAVYFESLLLILLYYQKHENVLITWHQFPFPQKEFTPSDSPDRGMARAYSLKQYLKVKEMTDPNSVYLDSMYMHKSDIPATI